MFAEEAMKGVDGAGASYGAVASHELAFVAGQLQRAANTRKRRFMRDPFEVDDEYGDGKPAAPAPLRGHITYERETQAAGLRA